MCGPLASVTHTPVDDAIPRQGSGCSLPHGEANTLHDLTGPEGINQVHFSGVLADRPRPGNNGVGEEITLLLIAFLEPTGRAGIELTEVEVPNSLRNLVKGLEPDDPVVIVGQLRSVSVFATQIVAPSVSEN